MWPRKTNFDSQHNGFPRDHQELEWEKDLRLDKFRIMSLKEKWLPSVRHYCYLLLQALDHDVKGALDLLRELGGGGEPCKDRQPFSVTWPWRLKNPSTFSERKDVRTKRWQHRSTPGREVSWVRVDKKPERCPGESLCHGHGRPKTLMWREYSRRNKAGLLFEHLLFISHCVIKIVLNLTSFILLL